MMKLKRLENQIKQSSNRDLRDFEKSVFEDRNFCEIQKYLKYVLNSALITPTVKLNNEEITVDKRQNSSIGISLQYLACVKM